VAEPVAVRASRLALRGRAYAAFGDTNEVESARARACLQEALKLEPRQREAWNALGELYANTGEYDRAEAAFRSSLAWTGQAGNAEALRKLSITLRNIENSEHNVTTTFILFTLC